MSACSPRRSRVAGHRSLRATLACLVIATIQIACPRPTPLADWAIEGVTVVDAVGGLQADLRVVIQGDRILWVGPTGTGGPEAARVIDGRDRFLIPGLFDAHVHFLYDPALTEAMAELFLAWGVTSVRDTGGDLGRLVDLRQRLEASERPAPRLFLSGPLLDGQHVVYDGATVEQPKLGTRVGSPEQARTRVRELRSRGADFIKIYELVDPAVFDALVDEARQQGLPIASHVPLSLSADVAGPRVDSMEHLRNIELACAADWRERLETRRATIAAYQGERGFELRRSLHESQRLPAIAAHDPLRCAEVIASLRDTLQVPTLRLNAFNRSRPDRAAEWQAALAQLPPAVARKFRQTALTLDDDPVRRDMRFADWSLQLVGRMVRQDVPIAAGTDTPIRLAIPGESLHRELELLVESGLSTRQALAAATVEPARFFALEDLLGGIAPGMWADLVLLRGNPLEDIRNTRTIEGVVSRGRWIDHAGFPD